MEYSEKYGQDVDEAVRLALDELNLTEDQVMVTVLEEPTKGFLGLGSKLAKVRVERIADAEPIEDMTQAEAMSREAANKPKTKANHDFRKKPRAQGEGGGSDGGRPARGDGRPRDRDRDRGPRDRDRDRDRDRGRGGSGRDRDRDRGPRDRDRDRNRNRDRDRDRVEDYSDIEIDISGIPQISEPIENLVPDPEGEATVFLRDVLEKMHFNVEIEGFKNDDCSYIEVKGEDVRMVIGKRGQTLDSLQYLANLVANKDNEDYKRVVIDVEGYRSRREKTLEELAVKLAKKVLKTGRNARLEPMNPYERKVIHATLQHVDGVMTKSEGEEPYRRVIIEKS
ncbi:MAG: protein jag [Clostridiales Family XIII bacterium]|nr:protein jag [Clostridiales Family XIII bacterium]